MKALFITIEDVFNGKLSNGNRNKKVGFFLLAFKDGKPMSFISNAPPNDRIQALEDILAREKERQRG